VLIKRLQSSELSARRRLLHEASILLMLDHPAIPRVLEVADPSGQPHLVLEHVEGMSLERVLNKAARRGQPMSEAFAAYVALQVAHGLHHAHTRMDERGTPLRVVHRSISPSTLWVTEEGTVKLIDFGAVRAEVPGIRSTDGQVLKGAAGYAAPEVLCMEAPDARADIFSLGLVLVEMLSLQHLYDPPRASPRVGLRGLFAKLRGRLLAEEPAWVDAAELAARAARLKPAEVERALAQVAEPLREMAKRALRVNPAERYPTAAAFGEELRDFLKARHAAYGPAQVVLEVRSVQQMAAREHGIMQTSGDPVPRAFGRQSSARH
jgi:eukaryotic-like serine/threonine-protein kinase